MILANNSCDSPPCTAKAWHDKSRKTFFEMKMALRKKLVDGGEEVQRATWGDWKSEKPEFKGIAQTDEGWT